MKNQEIADILYEIADILELENVNWKPKAYRKAALTLENLKDPIEDIAAKGLKAVEELPGIGEGIGKKIIEYCETGKIKEFEKLRKKEPEGLTELLKIQGIGPKKAELFFKKLRIKNVKDLEKAVESGKIKSLPKIKEKTVEDIRRGIGLYKQGTQRSLLSDALNISRDIISQLKKNKNVDEAVAAGSLRRMKETIGDIDILVTLKQTNQKTVAEIMDQFTKLDIVKNVLAKGQSKSAVIIKPNHMQVDIRVLSKDQFGSALMYFTGSKEHNIELRRLAIKKGWKLSEYGLFAGKKIIAGKTESDIYKKMNMHYIEPEMRENTGEIELAQKDRLPKPIGYDDIKGDLHMHTQWSDGNNTAEEMVQAAIKKGYEYIAITDHSKSRINAHGMDEKRLLKYIDEIKKLQKKYPKIKIMIGSEVDILSDGSLDYSDEILRKLDIVVAGIHAGFKQPKAKITQRLIKAMQNKYTTMIAHPTGRLINERTGYEFDAEKIFDAAKKYGKILEINAQPRRLDINDVLVRMALKKDVRLSIDTDAHSADELDLIELGIAQARRGFAEAKNVVNTLKFSELLKIIKR